MTSPVVLAFDPGREKIGLAMLDADGEILASSVIARDSFADAIADILDKHRSLTVAVGDGTGSDWVIERITAAGIGKVVRVSERNTTLEARELAWKANPPGCMWSVLPRLFWPTPKNLDAWAAVVIGRRALTRIAENDVEWCHTAEVD